MTDVGNMQAGAVSTAQLPAARPTIQVVPLMRRFVLTAGITGVMQVATLIIMTKVASQ